MTKPRMLILCTGNSARSQMAETLMKKYLADELDVFSAGLEPRGVHPYTIQVMQEVGFDLSHQSSKDVLFFQARTLIICSPCAAMPTRDVPRSPV